MPAFENNYPGAASLIQDIGKKMVVSLRGGRMFIGFLRIIDQFVDRQCCSSQCCGTYSCRNKFCDVPQGILLIRGENIIIIGDLNPEVNIDEKLERVSEKEIYKLQQEQTAARKELAKKRAELFAMRGLGLPDFLDIMFDDT
ncbi:U6 snRNA-associated Sm-like protein LSm1 [Schistosoma japonicum]|nr:U6 snRNA-associated Sm-like protein LSm1 [Schistosoma japonicum]